MSAKRQRKIVEDENEFEFNPTPRWCIEALLATDLIRIPGGTWIEPCAGTGRIVSTVNDYRGDINWILCEIQQPLIDGYLHQLVRPGRDKLLEAGDFVHREWPYAVADVLFMNPPFSLTTQFLRAAFERARWVFCLQRTNFFGSKERAPWFRHHCPDIFALPERPSFRADGQTDNCEYSWFVWPPAGHRRREGRVAMLEMPNQNQMALF